jgi:hypothetical protein
MRPSALTPTPIPAVTGRAFRTLRTFSLRLLAIGALAAVLAAVPGCGEATPATGDAGRPATADGTASGPQVCGATVNEYCGDSQNVCRFSAYTNGAAILCERAEVSRDCGGYDVVRVHGIDTGTYAYYDTTTGKLVAAFGYRAPDPSGCAAGPAGGFTPPSCPDSSFTPAPCGSGADGGPDSATAP